MMKKSKAIGFSLVVMTVIGFTFLVTGAAFAACPDNIAAYWKLDETTGSPYTDFISDNDGSVATGKVAPTAGTGTVNGAQLFDNTGGSETGIDVPASSSFNWAATDSFSIELWVNTVSAGAPGGTQVFMGRYGAIEGMQWWVGFDAAGNARLYLNDGLAPAVSITGTTSLSDGNWHHVVVVRNGTTDENILYADGVVQDAAASQAFSRGFDSGASELNIGWLNRAPFYHFNGLIDEVALYDRALTPAEIVAHRDAGALGDDYCGGSAAPGDAPFPDDTISLWQLEEAGGSTYMDGFGDNDGTGNADPTAATGTVNGAQNFDGATTGIDVPASSTFNWAETDSFSIELWVNTVNAGAPGGTQVFMGRYDANQGTGMQWWVGFDTNGYARLYLNDGASSVVSITGATSLSDGNWHHVVAVRNGTTDENILYADGVVQDAAASQAFSRGFGSGESELNIGWLNRPTFYHFNGLIDEVALYDRVLTPAEIVAHRDAGLAGDDVTSLRPEPLADAGADQSVTEGATGVALDGTGSAPNVGSSSIDTWLWEQTAGTSVTLTGADSATATFTAPAVGTSGETLTFRLTVTDDLGLSSSDTTTVTVNDSSVVPPPAGGGGGGGCFISALF
ncbi:MAG: LamG domain-containing protein [Desulfosarcina sp.]|nr:LamG domain-containing protein [Desulfosarcina sp.]